MDLHIGFESVSPAKVERSDTIDLKARTAGQAPKTILKAEKEEGRIIIDSETTLEGVPRGVWEYKLGNRSALEWVLDQYKESKVKDVNVRENFDAYRFAEYKELVIGLLLRVMTVSVETVNIVGEMKLAVR